MSDVLERFVSTSGILPGASVHPLAASHAGGGVMRAVWKVIVETQADERRFR